MNPETKMEPSRIETTLRAEADKELKKEIDDAIEPLMKISREGGSSLYGIEMHWDNQKVNGYGVVNALKDHVFNNLCERRRQKAIDAFMDKVNSLSTEIEDLRNSIPQ